ncbi:LysR family transcriptional regulator [Methylovirgula sp. 4M-Z18]|uniref:LysR family transcriptional regulator n=1 Tax=Methylovirgula sp. 4M-Z18 TaxID=2293567 RepID=UPI000E2F5F99|nr:LysR family transcriptional regulator [Methylovirgula sp. 4M-Z18]RFB78143.1 LysR family transcriptional regulator [Methylovirgula sp. 4M-Z18]
MDWDNARVFLAVARAGQFLAAARQLRVDHATVSRRVGAFEQQLGAKLFDRRPMGCFLTPAGEQLLAAAERMEAEMLRIQADLSASDVSISGTVRIGAPDGFGTLFLTRQIAKLMARHPSLTLQLVPVPRTFSLSKREADIAIVIDRPEEGRLAVRKLADYTLHFYAAKSYLANHAPPRTLDDLSAHTLVTYVQDILFSPALNFMPQLFAPQYRRFECASALGQASAVAAGAGLGVLHDYASWRDPALQVVLPDVVFGRTYWLVSHADTRDLMRVKTVSDFIVQEVRAARALFTPA